MRKVNWGDINTFRKFSGFCYIPMSPGIARLIQIVAGVVAIVYVLSAFGVFHSMSGVQVPQIR